MLKLLRVDDRLVHGQVAFAWTKSLNAQTIIVANDKVANDDLQKMTLKLAKPIGVDLLIVSVDEAVKMLKDSESNKKKTIAIVNNLIDAKRIIDETGFVSSLNLGGLRERPGSQRISISITLTEEDKQLCRQLLDVGVEVEIRMLPEDKKVLIDKYC